MRRVKTGSYEKGQPDQFWDAAREMKEPFVLLQLRAAEGDENYNRCDMMAEALLIPVSVIESIVRREEARLQALQDMVERKEDDVNWKAVAQQLGQVCADQGLRLEDSARPQAEEAGFLLQAIGKLTAPPVEEPRRFLGETAMDKALGAMAYDEFPVDLKEARKWLSERMERVGNALWERMQEKIRERGDGQ